MDIALGILLFALRDASPEADNKREPPAIRVSLKGRIAFTLPSTQTRLCDQNGPTMNSTSIQPTILVLLFLLPTFLSAQFNLDATTLAFERQRTLLAQADTLFLKGEHDKACEMYEDIFSDHGNNRQYAIRQVRCRSLEERPSQQMVEFLYSQDVDKYAIDADTVLGPYLNDILSNMSENPFVKDVYNSLLDSLHTADQEVRFSGSPLSEMWKVDSLNYAKLYQIFSHTGKKYIGSLGSIMVLIHTLYLHPKDMPFMISLLNEALLDGDIQPNPYAVILDEAFYSLCGCVPFGVFGSPDDPLPTCAGEKVSRLYRTRLLGD